jgi:AAA+ ATPase superfamily predicted ATPase
VKLINRVEELEGLEGYWKTKDPQFVVIYGKRRVGKTSLIKAFAQSKPHIYFLADKTTETENLKLLSVIVSRYFKDTRLEKNGFSDWYDFFEYLKQNANQSWSWRLTNFQTLRKETKACPQSFKKDGMKL